MMECLKVATTIHVNSFNVGRSSTLFYFEIGWLLKFCILTGLQKLHITLCKYDELRSHEDVQVTTVGDEDECAIGGE